MFEKILAGVAAALQSRDIPYMIIGGQAVLIYGEPRITRDIDLTLGINTDRLPDILPILEEVALRALPQDLEAFVRETMVLPAIHDNSGIRVDFIFSISPYESNAIGRSRKIRILDQDVRFASLEDTIILKIFAGRPRDLEDVYILLVKNPEIDKSYITSWLKDFDSTSEQKTYLKTFRKLLREAGKG